jgi:hypothetical protein
VYGTDRSELGSVRETPVDDICWEHLLYDAEDRLQLVVEFEAAPDVSLAARWRPKLPLLVLDGDRAELGQLVPHPRRGILDDIRNRDTFDCMVGDRLIGRIVRRWRRYRIFDSDGQVVARIRSFDQEERGADGRKRELRFPEPDKPLRPFALAALICGSPALGRKYSPPGSY